MNCFADVEVWTALKNVTLIGLIANPDEWSPKVYANQ